MKYVQHPDKYSAMGWAHAQAIAAGQTRGPCYQKGVIINEDGLVELPDTVAAKAVLRAGEVLATTKTQARSKPILRPVPIKPIPVKPTRK